MSIYTVPPCIGMAALSPDATGLITWKGINKNGRPVSSGIYYYIIQNGTKAQTGKQDVGLIHQSVIIT